MPHFTGKVIWITGASSGIGEALAYKFSAAGAKLILSSRRERELQRVREACASPEDVSVLPLDLLDLFSLEDKTVRAISAFGHIDIMVHNGGISQRSTVAETPLEVHRQVMELDYFSYVALSRHLLPHFLARSAGHFVVVSSVMGRIGTPMRSAYAAAKHALHGFFDCLRAEVSASRIKVTILTPGYIRTNISLNAVTADGSPLGIVGTDIGNGLPPGKAADQILRAVKAGKYEAYIGRFSGERFALLISRAAPSLFVRIASGLNPR
jgi:dehydrogenase/reductase SDR family protein 7B